MIVYKTYPDKDCSPCIEKSPQAVMIWLQEAQPGETITVEVMEMSEDEYNSLPEYMGP